jgi:hypothetical protein
MKGRLNHLLASGARHRVWRVTWIPTSIAALAVGVAGACTGSSPARCTSSLASACKDGGCGTYAETIALPCFGCGFGWSFGTFSCGGYQVIACGNTDVGQLQYYSGASGELVAIAEGGGANGDTKHLSCVAGPASFTPPPCAQSFNSTEGGSGLCTIPGPVPEDAGRDGADADDTGGDLGDAGNG